jgi:hypothetical protein
LKRIGIINNDRVAIGVGSELRIGSCAEKRRSIVKDLIILIIKLRKCTLLKLQDFCQEHLQLKGCREALIVYDLLKFLSDIINSSMLYTSKGSNIMIQLMDCSSLKYSNL